MGRCCRPATDLPALANHTPFQVGNFEETYAGVPPAAREARAAALEARRIADERTLSLALEASSRREAEAERRAAVVAAQQEEMVRRHAAAEERRLERAREVQEEERRRAEAREAELAEARRIAIQADEAEAERVRVLEIEVREAERIVGKSAGGSPLPPSPRPRLLPSRSSRLLTSRPQPWYSARTKTPTPPRRGVLRH